MLVSIVFAGLFGAGIVLAVQGWKKKSFFLSLSGGVLAFFGVALFVLDTMAEMKKAGMI